MEFHNSYIVTKRYRGYGLTNQAMNLSYGEPCRVVIDQGQGYIVCHDRRVCCVNSQTALDFFTQNDDKRGAERRNVINAIMKVLTKVPESEKECKEVAEKWDRVWDDSICQQYRRHDIEGHWLWSYEFYNAPVDDLRYIANLIGAEV